MRSAIHLIGLPTDHNSSFERGTALAPAAIREIAAAIHRNNQEPLA